MRKKYPQDKFKAVAEKKAIVKEIADVFFEKYEMSAPDFLSVIEDLKNEGLRRYKL